MKLSVGFPAYATRPIQRKAHYSIGSQQIFTEDKKIEEAAAQGLSKNRPY